MKYHLYNYLYRLDIIIYNIIIVIVNNKSKKKTPITSHFLPAIFLMLATKELQTIKKVLEEEFKLSPEYAVFQAILQHYGPSHSEQQVSSFYIQINYSNISIFHV